jgi:uncharacterized protein (TIGR00290 family)
LRTWLSWSSGKDSAWALHTMRQAQDLEVVGLLTSVTEPFNRVSMHGVRRELLEAQAESVGLPLHVVEIPSPCPNEVYEQLMGVAVDAALGQGVQAMAFGDLFLADIRAYRERMLHGTGLTPVFPLWDRPTPTLAREMIAAGLKATVTCIDPRRVDPSVAGRTFDEALLADLPDDVDPCAENGEFHTFAHDGPMFSQPIRIQTGEVVERQGFVFCDLVRAD